MLFLHLPYSLQGRPHIIIMDEKARMEERVVLRRLTFISVSISTAAVLSAVIAVPMAYSYLQVGSHSQWKITVDDRL